MTARTGARAALLALVVLAALGLGPAPAPAQMPNPPGAVPLELQLIPTGEIVSVSVLESSGSVAFDRSAIPPSAILAEVGG